MKSFSKITVALCLLTAMATSLVEAANLVGIRANNTMDHTRVVLDIESRDPNLEVKSDDSKNQVQLILPNTKNGMTKPIDYSKNEGLLKGVSITPIGDNKLKVTLQANQSVMHNVFALDKPDRLVVDLFTRYEQKTSTKVDSSVNYIRWSKSLLAGRVQVYIIKDMKGDNIAVLENKKNLSLSQWKKTEGGKVFFPISSATDSTDPYVPKSYLANTAKGLKILFIDADWVAKIGKSKFAITAINSTRGQDELILYTPSFGLTTKTNPYGRELIIEKGKVVAIGHGNGPLHKNSLVLSGHGKMQTALSKFKVGDAVSIQKIDKKAPFDTASTIALYGTPVLQNDQYVGPARSSDDGQRMSRSFVGVNSLGYLYLVAIEGNTASSVGVTYHEGAKLLQSLGIVDAVAVAQGGDVQIAIDGKALLNEGDRDKVFNRLLAIY